MGINAFIEKPAERVNEYMMWFNLLFSHDISRTDAKEKKKKELETAAPTSVAEFRWLLNLN